MKGFSALAIYFHLIHGNLSAALILNFPYTSKSPERKETTRFGRVNNCFCGYKQNTGTLEEFTPEKLQMPTSYMNTGLRAKKTMPVVLPRYKDAVAVGTDPLRPDVKSSLFEDRYCRSSQLVKTIRVCTSTKIRFFFLKRNFNVAARCFGQVSKRNFEPNLLLTKTV